VIVERPQLTAAEKLYFPAFIGGFKLTFSHLWRTFTQLLGFGRNDKLKKNEEPKKRSILDMSATGMMTMQYPEETWNYPDQYRGAPTLVKDEDGREKCVSCQLCEFVCPPRAIAIQPGAIPFDAPDAHVEKAPKGFDIDMIRCIYCGLCEEVCPEEAIWLSKDFPIKVAYERKEMVHDKEKLYEMGGIYKRPIKKWADK